MTNNLAPVALLIPLLAAAPGLAQAQTFETFGIRAQGMGGAFVAVSDDATATWWNPAGLATGGFFDSVVQNGSTTEPDDRSRGPISIRSGTPLPSHS